MWICDPYSILQTCIHTGKMELKVLKIKERSSGKNICM
jgi:hypothetical protein